MVKKNKKKFDKIADKTVDILQFFGVLGLAFFIAVTGTYVIGQLNEKIPEWFNVLFSLSVVLSTVYVLFNYVDKMGWTKDIDEATD